MFRDPYSRITPKHSKINTFMPLWPNYAGNSESFYGILELNQNMFCEHRITICNNLKMETPKSDFKPTLRSIQVGFVVRWVWEACNCTVPSRPALYIMDIFNIFGVESSWSFIVYVVVSCLLYSYLLTKYNSMATFSTIA